MADSEEPGERNWLYLLVRMGSLVRLLWLAAGCSIVVFILVQCCAVPFSDPWWDLQRSKEHIELRAAAEGGAEWAKRLNFEQIGWNTGFYNIVFHPMAGFQLAGPHQSAVHKEVQLTTDEKGMRTTWAAPDSDGAPIVYLFGGSTMWGWGTRDDNTIPSHVAKILASRGVRADVRNLGFLSYVSTQEVQRLVDVLQSPKERPAVVVFMDGLNDTQWPLQGVEPGTHQTTGGQREFFEWSSKRDYFPMFLWFLRQLPFQQAFSPAFSLAPPTLALDREIDLSDRISRNYTINLKLVRGLADGFGFEALFYWQPVINRKNSLTELEKKQIAMMHPLLQNNNGLVGRVAGILDGNSPDKNFKNIIDLFANDSVTRYSDTGHYTEDGNRIVAEAMVDDIERALRR